MAGLYVAGGKVVGVGLTYSSDDGFTWTTGGTPSGQINRGVCYSPERNLWVMVADGGNIFTSPDGLTWTSQTNPFGSSNVLDVTWANLLGVFIAVGDAGKLATSSNGTTWTSQTSGFSTSAIFGVAWSEPLGRLVAVGADGKVGYSTDGSSWTVSQPFTTNLIRFVEWCGSFGGMFITAADLVSGGPKLFTSPSGTGSWTQRDPGSGWADPFFSIYCGAEAPSLGVFVVGGDRRISITTDGSTFTTVQDFGSGNTWTGIAWSEELALFAAARDTAGFFTSTDGDPWTNAGQSGGTTGMHCIAWGGIPRRSGWLVGAVAL